jgi:hypothetical protein
MNTITTIATSVAAEGGDREEVRHSNHWARLLGANNVKTYSGASPFVKGLFKIFFWILAIKRQKLLRNFL